MNKAKMYSLAVSTALAAHFALATEVELVADGRTVTDPLTYEGDSVNKISGAGTVTVDTPVVVAGKLTYTKGDALVRTKDFHSDTGSYLPANTWTVAFDKMSLDVWEPKSISDLANTDSTTKKADPYFTEYDSTAKTGVTQFMMKDGTYTKCITVEYRENDDGSVSVRSVEHALALNSKYGFSDIRDIPIVTTLADVNAGLGKRISPIYYQIGNISFAEKGGAPTVRHVKEVDVSDDLTVDEGVSVIASGSNVYPAGTPSKSGNRFLRANGMFTFSGMTGLVVSNYLSGAGTLRIGEPGGMPTSVIINTPSGFQNNVANMEVYGDLIITNAYSKRRTGTLTTVCEGGVLHMQSGNSGSDKANYQGVYVIKQGGILKGEAAWALDEMTFTNQSGSIECTIKDTNKTLNGDWCAQLYLNNLTVADGGNVTGYVPRMRGGIWKFIGSSASTISSGLCLMGENDASATPRTNVLDVDDVTGDAAADAIFAGPLAVFNSRTFENFRLIKRGAGTLRIDVSSQIETPHPVEVVAGSLLVNANDIFPKKPGLKLGGGSLAVAAEIAAGDVGTLTVVADSTISVGGRGSVAFSDSSTVVWTDGAVCNIIGDERAVRFGTSSDALTATQKAALRLNGKPARLNASGYVTAVKGLMLLLK